MLLLKTPSLLIIFHNTFDMFAFELSLHKVRRPQPTIHSIHDVVLHNCSHFLAMNIVILQFKTFKYI